MPGRALVPTRTCTRWPHAVLTSLQVVVAGDEPSDVLAKRDPDPFYAKCNTRKWGQSKKVPLASNTEFCCSHWAFDKRKSQ